jgi:thymidylate kinase
VLIAFEGQDGAGKTTLLNATQTELLASGAGCVVVEEFSQSRHGRRLVDAVARDKFLRSVPGDESTVITRALEIAADLYYLDQFVIGPALSKGLVVLKDRHIDTNLYTVAPALIASGAIGDEAAVLAWLASLNAHLTHTPDLTVYVDAPLAVRIARIVGRVRSLVEDRPNDVSPEDINIFNERDRIARRLMARAPDRYLLIVNNENDPMDAALRIIAAARMRAALLS